MTSTVVIGYDQSPSGDRALARAGREAAWRGAAVEIVTGFHWVALSHPVAYMPVNVEDAARKIADAGVQWLRHRHPGLTAEAKVIAGPIADALAEASRDADLLVLGNRGRGGFAGLLLGSVSMRTLALASCPTLVVRGTPREPAGSIVLALDVEDPADEVIDFAFAEASLRAARLTAVDVWDLSWTEVNAADSDDDLLRAGTHAVADIRAALESRLNPWQAKYPDVRLTVDVVDGSPGAVLTGLTKTVDLIVAGAHRRGDGRLGMRPGPLVHTLLHHADCPVVVVPRA